MSTPFSYHVGTHLTSPKITLTQTGYPTTGPNFIAEAAALWPDGVTVSGGIAYSKVSLTADDINNNFMNLSISAVDNTARILTIENATISILSTTSTSIGSAPYTGFIGNNGTLYGGTPLLFTGTVSNASPTLPAMATALTFRITPFKVTTPTIAYQNQEYIIPFGSVPLLANQGAGGTDSTFPAGSMSLATLAGLMNTTSYMKGNTNNATKTSTITGNGTIVNGVNTGLNLGGTFIININNSPIIFHGSILPGAINSSYTTASQLVGSIQNAIDTAFTSGGYSAGMLTVGYSSNNLTIAINATWAWNVNNTSGIYSFKISNTTGRSVLSDAGLVTGSQTSCQGYDFTNMLQFGTSTTYLTISGINASFNINLKDNNNDTPSATSLLSFFGITFSTNTTYYHTQIPSSANYSVFSTPLNYGGDLHLRDIYGRNMYISGATYNALTLTGITNTSSIVDSGNLQVGATLLSGVTLSTNDVGVLGTLYANSLVLPASASGILNLLNPVSTHIILGNVTIGVNTAQTLTVNSNVNFTNAVSFGATASLAIGSGISLQAGSATISASIITASTTFNATATANISKLIITNATPTAGTFDNGAVLPTSALTNTLNYGGVFSATTLQFSNGNTSGSGAGLVAAVVTGGFKVLQTSSDIRLKKDINTIPYGITELRRLEPVSFYWKKSEDNSRNIGFIAQQLRNVIPETVFGEETEKDYLSVNTSYLIPVLVKALQELDIIVQDQSKIINELKNRT